MTWAKSSDEAADRPRVLSLTPEDVVVLNDALHHYAGQLSRWCGLALDDQDAARERGHHDVIAAAKYETFQAIHAEVYRLQRALLEAHKTATTTVAPTNPPAAVFDPQPSAPIVLGSSVAQDNTPSALATPCAGVEDVPGRGGRDGDPVPSPAAVTETPPPPDCRECSHAWHAVGIECQAVVDSDEGLCLCTVEPFGCPCDRRFPTVEALSSHGRRCLVIAKNEDWLERHNYLDGERLTPREGHGWRAPAEAQRLNEVRALIAAGSTADQRHSTDAELEMVIDLMGDPPVRRTLIASLEAIHAHNLARGR